MAVDAVEARRDRAHEGEPHGLGTMPSHGLQGHRALHRNERAMIRAQQPHARRQPCRKMRVVRLLGRRVDDQKQHAVLVRIDRARHHQVVDDAAVFAGELGVALAAGREADDIAGHERFERARDRLVVGADEERLAHVRDVEQAGSAAHMIVLGDDALGILHRHVVAGERHHARPARHVQRMQRGLPERHGRRRRRGVAGRDRGSFGRMLRRKRRASLGRCLGRLRVGGFGRLGHDRFRQS